MKTTLLTSKFKIKLKFFFQGVISVWLCWHLLAMVLMPNLSGYLGRSLYNWLTPYSAMVGLNAGWNFFSPDPAHTMYYKVLIQDREKDTDPSDESVANDINEEAASSSFFIPENKNQYVSSLNQRRILYAVRYMTLDPRRVSAIMAPWLCRRFPKAEGFQVNYVIESIPFFDSAIINKSVDMSDLTSIIPYMSQKINCDSTSEVSL